MKIKKVVRDLTPPLIWDVLKKSRAKLQHARLKKRATPEGVQDLELYWDENMASLLETWGDGNVWNEIPMFFFGLEGKVLDIACGTGKTMVINKDLNPKLDIYGCDISDLLIKKAAERGLPTNRLIVCDATKLTDYADNFFDYAYSIGSLEHFTEDGIEKLVAETHRVVRKTCFHMMPTSRSLKNEGWMKTWQTFYNNSPDWWVAKFRMKFPKVLVFDSAWNDSISVGKWFVTVKE